MRFICGDVRVLIIRTRKITNLCIDATAPHLPNTDRPSHTTLTVRPETSQLPMRSFCT
jgi:hypothetical protein